MRQNRMRLGLIAAVVAVLSASGCRIAMGLLALVIATVIVGGMIEAALRGELGPPPVPTPIASRTVVEATLPLHEHWRRNGVVLPFYDERVVASGGYVCFVDYRIRGWQREDRLQVLNAASGETRWQVADFPHVISLATDGQRLFAAVHWHIRAYDLANGRLLWRTPGQLPGHTGYWIQPVEEDILVYSTETVSINREEQVLRRYDAQSGTLKEVARIEVPPNVGLMVRSPSMDYWTDGERFWAEDRTSGQVRWQVEIERRLEYWPVLTGSSVIYASGLYPRLYAVDTTTGVLQWTYPGPLVSNFVLSHETLYAIRKDGVLVGIDPRTGQEIGHIQFAPAETERRSAAYWVAASDGLVFAYFGDSQELIALGP